MGDVSYRTAKIGMGLPRDYYGNAEVPMNVNIRILDFLSQPPFVIDTEATEPVAGMTDGDTYIVAVGATGTNWSGHDNDLAYWNDDTEEWMFFTPYNGLTVRNDKGGGTAKYQVYDSSWGDW